MLIRKAELKDVEQCEFISKIPEFKYIDGSYPSAKYFKKCLNKIFLVAKENDVVAGYVLGFTLIDEYLVYLDLIAVHKDFRGKQIGTKLLNAFREELKNQGVKYHFLISPNMNEKSLNFYRKNGLSEGKQFTLFTEEIK